MLRRITVNMEHVDLKIVIGLLQEEIDRIGSTLKSIDDIEVIEGYILQSQELKEIKSNLKKQYDDYLTNLTHR